MNKLAGGDFHDKFGIFTDAHGQQIALMAPIMKAFKARNYESLKIFPSWQAAFEPMVRADIARFERLWSNEDPNVQSFYCQRQRGRKYCSCAARFVPIQSRRGLWKRSSKRTPKASIDASVSAGNDSIAVVSKSSH
ncbi:MAG: hypothetical protein R2911_34955 [Caldilineaceae bacterium]